MALTMDYIETPVKASKSKNIKLTSKNQAIKGLGELGTHEIVWQLVVRHKLALIVSTLVLENAYLIGRFLGLI